MGIKLEIIIELFQFFLFFAVIIGASVGEYPEDLFYLLFYTVGFILVTIFKRLSRETQPD